MENNFLLILKKKDFSQLWLAQLLSQTASHMLTFALILHIYDLTKSLTTISLVIIASTIPSVIFGPFSGTFSDKIRNKKILTYTNILRFLVVLLLIPAADNTLAILEIIFLMATITQFFAPAELSSIPLLVTSKQLVAANSIFMTTMYGTLIAGYAVAGPLQALIGSKWLFLLVALLYLVSAFSVWSMSEYDKKEAHRDFTLSKLVSSVTSIWQSTRRGLQYIRSKRNIFTPMLKLTLGWAMLGAFIVVAPGFAEQVLGVRAQLAGILLIAPAGIGMLIASYLLNKHKEWDKNAIINCSFIICGISLLVLSIYSFYASFGLSLLVAIILMVILGFSAACVYISSQTLLHLNAELKMRGRVFGIAAMLINLALGIPALFVGGIADLTSPVITLILVALILIIYGTSLFFEDNIESESVENFD